MIPALALGTERPLAGVMDVPPRPRTERLLNLPILLRTYLFLGTIEAMIAMGGFFLYLYSQGWTRDTPLDWSAPLYKEATTVTFAGIVLAQVANVFACRSDRLSIRRLGWFTNQLIVWGVVTELILLMLITYTPVGNDIFGTGPLPLWIYGLLALGALTLLLAEEGRKIIVNRRHRRMNAGMAPHHDRSSSGPHSPCFRD
ncbi:MAG: cation transporting ATPase C-terminal domain-containing protein [Nitrospira sp.]|nr:cation transporting ATPase C-terminal domain-containing protein [Nitrospira sp.]